MKVLITGDIHGDFGQLNNLLNKKRPDLTICCGDFGYWPKLTRRGEDKTIDHIKTQGSKILWCDGNHEDHWSIRDRETDELAPNIFYMPRGSTYTLEDGRTIMFMGGGESIDKMYRTLGRDWFPEEVISSKDMQNLPEKDVDIFITHTCPNELVGTMKLMYPEKGYEPSNQALSQLWEIYKPKLWFFGHWHQFKEGVLGETKWTCLDYPGHGGRWWTWLPD
jgi:Icc-related predicted phosphoesterase